MLVDAGLVDVGACPLRSRRAGFDPDAKRLSVVTLESIATAALEGSAAEPDDLACAPMAAALTSLLRAPRIVRSLGTAHASPASP